MAQSVLNVTAEDSDSSTNSDSDDAKPCVQVSKKSRSSIGKEFSDLDGNIRKCLNSSGLDSLFKWIHIFRLLDPLRCSFFLVDNKLNVDCWRARVIISLSMDLPNRPVFRL